ncbi:Hypothetical predicted protein [Podarcis lilfordi]|uniref:Uncharacterized protein n=1 Tax=Podarcis lilfordi TaxID=74358 RepID=A0AA35KBT4_9SAUR|nr:Hypothetical predicted protein [Podarcis lilfordi]
MAQQSGDPRKCFLLPCACSILGIAAFPALLLAPGLPFSSAGGSRRMARFARQMTGQMLRGGEREKRIKAPRGIFTTVTGAGNGPAAWALGSSSTQQARRVERRQQRQYAGDSALRRHSRKSNRRWLRSAQKIAKASSHFLAGESLYHCSVLWLCRL